MVNILEVEDDLSTEELSGIFSAKVNSGEIESEQVMSLQMFTVTAILSQKCFKMTHQAGG